MISIFFYFNSESKKVQQSINSILKQTSDEFELFIVDCSNKAMNLTIDTSSLSKVKFFKTNLENNIAYFANQFLTQATGKYVYFMGHDVELEANFVKMCNSVHTEDFAIFSNNTKNVQTIMKNKIKDLDNAFLPSLEDKIFSNLFLKNNSIYFPLNKFNTLSFLYKVLTKFNSCKILPMSTKIQILPSSIYSDLYFTGEIVTSFLHDYKQSYFWEQNYKQIEFLVSYFIIFLALPSNFSKNKSIYSREIAISFFDKFLEDNFSEWKDNNILNSETNIKFKKNKLNVSLIEKVLVESNNGK